MATCLPPKLALVGLRGAGKSVCGQNVAERLGLPFIDLDERIAAAAGVRHAGEVIARDGLGAFRERERDELRASLSEPTRLVLSTGGGAIEDPSSRALLRSQAVTVWLRAPLSLLRERIAADESAQAGDGGLAPLRPSLVGDGRDELTTLLERRAPWYREVARRAVDVDGLDPDEIGSRLIEIWLG